MALRTAPTARAGRGLFGARNQPANDTAIADELGDVLTQLKSDFLARDELYQDIDDVLFGNLPIDIPEAYRKTAIEVRTPLALHIANTVTAALSINPFSIQFKPIGFGDTYQQNATLREHFFEAAWQRQEQEARRPLLRLFMSNLAVKGEGILKTVERTKRAWGDYNLKSQQLEKALAEDRAFDTDAKDRIYHNKTEQMKLLAPYPIATTDVPPETFYYTKNEDGFTFQGEVKQLPWYDTLQRYHAGVDRRGRITTASEAWNDPQALGLARSEWDQIFGRQKTITVAECWDDTWCTVLGFGPGQASSTTAAIGNNGTVLRRFMHGYGDPFLKTLRGPYFHALGVTTASRLPERAGLSILFGWLRLFVLLDSLYTMRANAAYMTAFPAFKRTLPPGSVPGLPGGLGPYGNDGSEDDAQDDIEPGMIYPYDIAPVEMPKAGVESDKLIADIRQFVELALPSIVQGVVAGDESGYALNQAAHLARLAWDPIVSNGEVALGDMIGFQSWLIERRIGETVYAWGEQQGKNRKQRGSKAGWLGFGPEDAQGVHRYTAKLDPETPSNKVIELRAITEAMQAKLVTYEDAVEQAGGNPDEVERSWLLHDLKQSPEIQSKLYEQVFQRLSTIQAKRLQAPGMPTPEQMTGAPPPGAQGGMPANPVPSPGNGLPLQPPPGNAAPTGPLGNRPGGIAGAPVVPNQPPNPVVAGQP